MIAKGIHSAIEFHILEHILRYAPLTGALVGGNDFDLIQLFSIQGSAQPFDPFDVIGRFVPNAHIIDVDVMILAGCFKKSGDIVGVVLGVELPVADPVGRAPFQGIEKNGRMALFGLLHQKPFIASIIKIGLRMLQFCAGMGMAGFGAAGGIDIAADFDFEMLQACAVTGLEQQVEDLASIWLGIVQQQSRRGAGAQGADAFKRSPLFAAVDGYDVLCICRTGIKKGCETAQSAQRCSAYAFLHSNTLVRSSRNN